ncbi:MAG: helix-turn-helix domain-containing protein, partial [Cetobacterium sp.]
HKLEPLSGISSKSKNSVKSSQRYQKSKEMFLGGFSLEEIAEAQNIQIGTVLSHLNLAKENYPELVFDFSTLYTLEEKNLLIKAVEVVGRDFLRPIKDQLPESFSYEKIKLILLDI